MVYVKNNWWKILIIVLFATSLLFLANTHEHWSDEAQSFLLARDNNFLELMHYVKYEGTPPLWTIIIKIFILLGGTYETFYLLPIISLTIGVAIFELKIKAPWYIKVLFPFTYYIFYQYGVVARSYCLILPIIMTIISMYEKRLQKPIVFAGILLAFMNISLHTLMISGSLYLLFLIDVFKDSKFKNKEQLLACILLFFELLITAIQTYPNPDCGWTGNGGRPIYHIISEATIGNNLNIILEVVITCLVIGVIIYSNKEEKLNGIIRSLILFVPVIMVCRFITQQVWHVGIIFILMLSYFIVNDSINTKKIVKIALVIIFMVQIYWSASSFIYDYNNKYTASKDVAEFLIQNGYDKKTINGIGFSVTAIQPYFNSNIFANYNTDKAFYKWSRNNGYDIKRDRNTDIFIIAKFYEGGLEKFMYWIEKMGYKRIDFDGYTYLKDSIYETEGYRVYIRNDIDN